MEQQIRQYPVGEQDFRKIRVGNGVYIDKTEYVYRMTHTLGNYYFLSRPRRFGKSLLVSTLEYYFQGERELFDGLVIGRLETEWEKFPVLRFDMSQGKNFTPESLTRYLDDQLKDNEKQFGITPDSVDANLRLKNLIREIAGRTGKQVVVLIDEYDTPLLDVAHDPERLEEVRKIMSNFYSVLKGNTKYLRFVFLTGITKFSQLGLFSGFNNIQNISMDSGYAGVCGITKTELKEQMKPDIEALSNKLTLSPEETLQKLVENYDGYHFCWPSDDIFNPFSLLNAFNTGEIDDYWFETGTSSYMINLLRKFDVKFSSFENLKVEKSGFNTPLESSDDCIALLYQAGYLTIKDYEAEDGIYSLGLPNKEVRVGLMENLLRSYLPNGLNYQSRGDILAVRTALRKNDIGAALGAIREFLKRVPYANNANTEGHYQEMMACVFVVAGAEVSLEERTRNGRIDMVVRTKTRIYIIELKLDKSAGEAMEQIEGKDYAALFAGSGLPIVKVAANFSTAERNITDWVVG